MYITVIKSNEKHLENIGKRNYRSEQDMHRLLCYFLDGKTRSEEKILYRKLSNGIIIVQSKNQLKRHRVIEKDYEILREDDIERLYSTLRQNDMVEIRVHLTPEVHYKNKNKRRPLTDIAQRLSWVQKKINNMGFSVNSYVNSGVFTPLITEEKLNDIFVVKNGFSFSVPSYEYKIRASVMDREKILENIFNGIGNYRSYGNGLLIVGLAR